MPGLRPSLRWKAALFVATIGVLVLMRRYVPLRYDISQLVKCGICIVWCATLFERIVRRDLRVLLTMIASLMLMLLFVQALNYSLQTAPPQASIALWYLYYVPLVLVPLLSFLVACCIGRGEQERAYRRWLWLLAPAACLIVLVLTNNLHQCVFAFETPHDLAAYQSYSHAWGYYPVFVWEFGFVAIAFGLAIRNSAASLPSKRPLWIPVVILLGEVLYTTAYVLNGNASPVFFREIGLMFQEMFCLTIGLFFESLIQIGVIPSNNGYEGLFEISGTHAQIVDHAGIVRFCARGEEPISVELIARARTDSVRIDEHTVVKSFGIRGGRVYWQTDLTQVHKLQAFVKQLRQELAEKNSLLEDEIRVREERARTEAGTALMDEMLLRSREPARHIRAKLADLESTSNPNMLLAQVLVLGTYLKRRVNLALIAMRRGEIPAEELLLSCRESAHALSFCGIACSVRVERQGSDGIDAALRAYGMFEQAAEHVMLSGEPAELALSYGTGMLTVRMDPSGRGGANAHDAS